MMLEQVIIISLIELTIHVCMWDGMIFGKLRACIDSLLYTTFGVNAHYISMPLYECPTCMGGIWTLVIYPVLYGLSWTVIPVMLAVIGCNTLLATFINKLNNGL